MVPCTWQASAFDLLAKKPASVRKVHASRIPTLKVAWPHLQTIIDGSARHFSRNLKFKVHWALEGPCRSGVVKACKETVQARRA